MAILNINNEDARYLQSGQLEFNFNEQILILELLQSRLWPVA
jgi:hypothetical protein